MRSALDSGKFVGPVASIKQMAKRCGLTPPYSLTRLLRVAGCPLSSCITLHIKILTEPVVPLAQMLSSMRQVYQTAGIAVMVATRQILDVAALAALNDLDAGGCCTGCPTSAEQTALYQHNDNVALNDLVAYFVQTVTQTTPTVQILNGCTTVASAAAAISQGASRWTLAHEMGHALGLSHITGERDSSGKCITPDRTRLMTGCSTDIIVGVPTVSSTEIATMNSSPHVRKC